jgi:putative MATE family efflux protein
MTYDYMFVMFAGTFTLVSYGLISNIIRALGDSITSVVFLIVSCLVNIGLDYWFILGLDMGCGGAAWATVASQGFSALLCLVYVIWKFPILKLQRKDWRWDLPFYKDMLRLSLPMALQFTVTAVGVVILQAVLNKFGPIYMAAVTTAAKLESIASMPLFSFGMAIATFAAQNYGANNYIRVRDGVRSCAWLVTAIAVVGMFVAMAIIKPFGAFFIKSNDKQILDAMQLYTNISSSQYIILGLLLVYRNALQGLGHTFIPLMGGAAELVMRAFAALVLARFFGFVGVAWSHPLAWYGAFILLIIDYRRVIRKLLPN